MSTNCLRWLTVQFGKQPPPIFAGLLLAVVVGLSLPTLVYAQESTVTEYPFDAGSDGWECHASDGYLFPNPDCLSPVITGARSVSVAAFFLGDTNGAATVRLLDQKNQSVCEASQPVPHGETVRVDLFCSDLAGSYRLQTIESSGDHVVDFVRVETVASTPPTPTPAPATATPPPTATPSPTAVPSAPIAYNQQQVGRLVGLSAPAQLPTAPASPTATPHPDGACVAYVRLADKETGGPLFETVQLRLVSVDVEHYRTISDGYGVARVPCGDHWLTVVDLRGRVLADPQFVSLAGESVRLDLLVRDLDALPLAQAVAVGGGDWVQRRIAQAIEAETVPQVETVAEVVSVDDVADVGFSPGDDQREETVAQETASAADALPAGAVAYASGNRGTAREVVSVPVRRGGLDVVSLAALLGVLALVGLVVGRVLRSGPNER